MTDPSDRPMIRFPSRIAADTTDAVSDIDQAGFGVGIGHCSTGGALGSGHSSVAASAVAGLRPLRFLAGGSTLSAAIAAASRSR